MYYGMWMGMLQALQMSTHNMFLLRNKYNYSRIITHTLSKHFERWVKISADDILKYFSYFS